MSKSKIMTKNELSEHEIHHREDKTVMIRLILPWPPSVKSSRVMGKSG